VRIRTDEFELVKANERNLNGTGRRVQEVIHSREFHMTPLFCLFAIALTFLSPQSLAVIQDGDFRIYEGSEIQMRGARGRNMDIEYVGPPLTAKLTIQVTPDDKELKVNPSTCTFTRSENNCLRTLRLVSNHEKDYGQHQYLG
jgi:hypothetical protein